MVTERIDQMSSLSPFTPDTRIETFADGLTVRIDERGSGRPILVLHGGGGPQTVSGFAAALSTRAHVLTPIHPGFGGEPRPEWFNSIDDLALTYLELLERLDLRDVMVVGFSIGGWIAAELAVRDTTRLGSIVLVDAVGIGAKEIDQNLMLILACRPLRRILGEPWCEGSLIRHRVPPPVVPDPPRRAQTTRADVPHQYRLFAGRTVRGPDGGLDAAVQARGCDPRRADHHALSLGARRAGAYRQAGDDRHQGHQQARLWRCGRSA